MKNYKTFLRESKKKISKALDENYLTIFCGAGISVNAGIPAYSDLMSQIENKLGIKEKDYRKLAGLFYNCYGKNSYYDTLNQILLLEQRKPNAIHEKIANMNFKNIITTNWDNLFEKAIDNSAKFYDIIMQDSDFGDVGAFPKLIKMHGDLKTKNIVFTDDDYLNYSQNFPLIENYIKGIFSTDIVIMIGYSLSDENVKQIISWINRNSDNLKPIYFISDKKFTDIEFRYYQKQNIYIIYLDKEANIDSLDARGKKLYGFLNSIDNENFNINELSNREIIEKTISALEPLNSYKIIMDETIVDIIQKTFNLSYEDITIYANKININNEKLCKAYKVAKKFDYTKTEKFFKNLIDKTQIISFDFCENKIICNNDNKNTNDYILNFEYQKIENRLKELNTNEIFNIEDEFEKAFLLYLNFQFDESYLAFKKLSNKAFKEKNYRIWYISEFNKKATLPIDDYENKVKIYEKITAQNKKINLNELVTLLPKSYRITIKPIKDYQENSRHKSLNQMYELELKAIREKEQFKNGGFSINNNLNEAYSIMNKQYDFIMQNMLTIIYSENIRKFFDSFCKIYFTYLSIQVFCLNRNEPHILKPEYTKIDKNNKIINFNKYSIFALSIFSMKREDIIKIMKEFDGFKFKLYNDDKKLADSILLRIFNNIIAKIDKNPKFSSFVNNFLILLAHFQIEKETFAQIIKLMTEKLKKRYFSWNEYESLNYFIVYQYNKNRCFDDEQLFKFIDSFINNFVCDKINYHDREAMSRLPIFGNIFSILPKNKFSNSTLVSKFLNILQEYDKDFQSRIIPNFIIGLYLISTDEIQKNLETYINKFIKNNEFSIDILGAYYLMYANNILNISFDDMKKYIAEAREKFPEKEEIIADIEKDVMNIFKKEK